MNFKDTSKHEQMASCGLQMSSPATSMVLFCLSGAELRGFYVWDLVVHGFPTAHVS